MERVQGSNVLMIGFMGSGKTSVGKELARMLGFQFVDTDEEVVRLAGGRPVTRIFEEEGEAKFREMEAAVFAALAGANNLVVSTGGGLPLREENRALMAGMGFVVWLDAPLQAIVERVAANSRRPLLQGENLEAKVGKLLAERREVYRGSADLRVETNGLSVQEVAYGVAESVRVYFAGRESKQSD